MRRNAYTQVCVLFVVLALSLSGLSMLSSADDSAPMATAMQDRTMSINGVAVDGDDNIIVTGEVYDDGAGKWIIRTEKYDGDDGHLLWRKEFKEYDHNIGKDVVVDGNGNIIVVGAVGSAGDILPQMDYFLIKYGSNGNQVWKKTHDNGLSDVPWRATIDEQTGNVFLTGVTIKLVGTESATSNFWTVKCSGSNGGLMAEHVLDVENNADMGLDVALTSAGDVIVAGSTQFDGPDYNAYCMQRYSSSLDPRGGPFFYRGDGTNESASGIVSDSNDNIFVTGHSSGSGGQDFLTIKYNDNDVQVDDDLLDVGGKDDALAIACDQNDNVIVAGFTTDNDGKHFYTIKYSNGLGTRWDATETSFRGEAKAVAVDSQNNIVVAGYNTDEDDQYYTVKYDGSNGNALWRGGGGSASEPAEASFTAPGSAAVGQPVQFTDTSTGDVESRSWSFGDGGTATGASPTHTYTSPGTYTVRLTVNAGEPDEDEATRQITISNAPPKPSFSYTPLAPTVGQAVSFDAADSYDPYGGSIASYSWDFGDESDTASGQTTSHTYTGNGTYTVTLTVTDNEGATATTQKMVTVNPAGAHAPTAQFSYQPASPGAGEDVTFDASATTDDGTILLYRWDWDADGTYDDERAAATVTHSWPDVGTYPVTLEVEDDNGTTSTYTASVTVGGGDPSLVLSAPASIDTSGGTATVFVTVTCLNQMVDGVHIEVEEDAGATVQVTPSEATMQAGAERQFELSIDLPANASGNAISIRAVGGDGVQSDLVDISLDQDSDGTPGFAALLAIAAIFIVLLAMRRFR